MPAGIVRPVDAAGLVLIRAGRPGPEVLLGRRHRRLAFLPNVFVSPGGRVDRRDSRPSGFPEAISPRLADQLRRGGRRDPAAFLRAALRETFEESGLLLVQEAAAAAPPPGESDVWRAYRRMGARPAFAAIGYICRAITPTSSSRRFNTRFFLADGGQAAGELGGCGELEDLAWHPVAETRRLALVDVTEFVLNEALRRWRRPAGGGAAVPLLSYRDEVMRLRPSPRPA
ncbi:MAG: hypothetical protein WEC41_03680 [Dongiaceae bacterium]